MIPTKYATGSKIIQISSTGMFRVIMEHSKTKHLITYTNSNVFLNKTKALNLNLM